MHKPIGDWRAVAMDLWYSPDHAAILAANEGFERALSLLARAAASRPEEVRLFDVSRFAEFDRWQIYARHAKRCSYWGYALADVFSSRSRAGSLAGLTVPLLSVHFREAEIPCVAPHHDTGQRPRALRTILDMLRALSRSDQVRLFGEEI